MTCLNPVAGSLLLMVVAGLLVPNTAHAYLDSSTGSMVLQAVVATAAASAYVARSYWSRINSFLRGKPPEAEVDRNLEEHGE